MSWRGLQELGSLEGKSASDFVDALGAPRCVKTMVSGRRLVEWREGLLRGRMLVVEFDLDDRFDRIVACHPNTRPCREATAPSSTTEETMSVRQTLALIDLRDRSPQVRIELHGRR